MKTLIIDDEKNVREALQSLVKLWCPQLELIGEATGVADAFEKINELKPELIFLDVEMGDGTGFDLLRRLPDHNFEIIFATAHQHYAIEAIRMSACDFLLKPVDPDELVLAVDRAQKTRVSHGDNPIDVMLQHTQGIKDRIVLKDMENIYVIKISDIIRCEADGRYTKFFVLGYDRFIMVSTNLKEYDQMLSPSGFARIHHSHFVNLSHVQRIDKVNLTVHLTEDQKVPISIRKKDELLKKL